MNLSVIVAVSQNGVIGREGGLPWHISADLKRFKALTMGHCIIMGRKTFESLGRCLPGRTNIVVSEKGFAHPIAQSAASLAEALEIAAEDAEPFVIGGARLFEAARPLAHRLYLTRVLQDVAGDTYMDLNHWELNDATRWQRIECSPVQTTSDDAIPFQFETWARPATARRV